MAKDVLKFKEVELQNFRPFQKQKMEFSQDSKKPITIFEGRNSAGKTSIIHAINWCLYEEERIDNTQTAKPRCSSPVLNSLKVGETIETFVQITFSDETGKPKYIIKRTLTGEKKFDSDEVRYDQAANGEVSTGITFFTTVEFSSRKKDGSWDVTDNPGNFYDRVSKIIPKVILEFIIFDGEQLDNFFKEDSAKTIKIGIEKVSGLPIIDRAIVHWESIEKQFSKRVAKASGTQAQILQDLATRIENSINKLKKDIGILIENKKELKIQEGQLQVEHEKFPVKALEELQQHLDDEKRHKQEYQDAVERFRVNRQKYILENFPRILCANAIKKASKILDDSETEGLTPPPIYDFYLEKLIHDKKCMCGTDLISNEKAMTALIKLKEKVSTSSITKLANEGKEVFDNFSHLPTAKVNLEELNQFRGDEQKYAAAFREAQEKVDGLFAKLEDFDEKKIRKTALSLKTIREQREKVRDELQLKNSQLHAKEVEQKQVLPELEKAEGETDTNKMWKERKNFATKTKDYFLQIKDELLQSIRITVQDRTKEIFQRLISKGGEIQELKIDSEYNITIVDNNGDSLFPLSAGQRLYLSLSYIAAIREVTDTNFPMLIDSPLGRVDGWARVEAAKVLPFYLPETQIALLVTNVEYDATIEKDAETGKRIPSIRSIWKDEKKIWRRFVLKFPLNQTESTNTEIVEVEN